eukprot:m.120524 g.120524  ORF g.120524 m.120524 type:complete len:159 (+) comp37734_c0_seq5:49-525(+)
MASKPLFRVPDLQDNPDGWGPCELPTQFKGVPYQPFSKSDRLGKASDWTGNVYSDKKYLNRYQSQLGAGGTVYNYTHEEDESKYKLVDTAKVQRSAYQKQRIRTSQARWQDSLHTRRRSGLGRYFLSLPLLSYLSGSIRAERAWSARGFCTWQSCLCI